VSDGSQLTIVSGGPTPEEAAAVVAALEQFERDTATTQDTGQRAGGPLISPWQRAALAEGVVRQPVVPEPWR
jgi:Acyl-CoA carboxylase epsilon subunit